MSAASSGIVRAGGNLHTMQKELQGRRPVPLAEAAVSSGPSSGDVSIGRRIARLWLGLLLLLAGACARAHEVPDLAPHNAWAAWSGQAWLWLLWAGGGALVLRGTLVLWRRAAVGAGIRRWQAACFVAGWLAIGVAVLSPLDALGDVLFWAHMVQHEVMMLVAAPLLVLSRPLAALVWGLPSRWRPGAAVLARRLGLQAAMHVLTRPLTAWWVHAVVLWAWHAPVLFQAAVRQQGVHDVQHTSFFIAALVFWWALFQRGGGRGRHGAAVLYLFTTAVHTSVLGALLTFSPRPWYPVYEATASAWGWSALHDQQLGGLIMWVPGGMVYLVAALVLLAAWIGTDEHRGGIPARAGR